MDRNVVLLAGLAALVGVMATRKPATAPTGTGKLSPPPVIAVGAVVPPAQLAPPWQPRPWPLAGS